MNGKLTKAQRRFLGEHVGDVAYYRRGIEDGYRPRHLVDRGSVTYDFVGRCQTAGWIEIVDGENLSWPWGWDATRITDLGRAALKQGEPM